MVSVTVRHDGDSGRPTGRGAGVRPRPRPDQPLRARWDPTESGSRVRLEREDRHRPNGFRRLIANYGWRVYAIPVLLAITVALIVVTVRGEGAVTDTAADVTPDNAVRNTEITNETAPVGAPTEVIQQAALPAGALPAGGPYTTEGDKVYRVVPGTAGRVGGPDAQEYTYTVEVEEGVDPADFGGDGAFARLVEATLANPRSWIGGGEVAFRRIDSGTPDLRISMTSTDTARELCGYQIELETSCFYPPAPHQRVVLNEARWVRGAISYQGDDLLYRQYLINHEVGHGIGYEAHEACPADGALAPVMMQQTFGTANSDVMALDPYLQANRTLVCQPNPWPFPAAR